MASDKIVFIIPGFYHSSKLKIYQDIAKKFEDQGIKPIILNIPWKKKIMSDYVTYFLKEYTKVNAEKIYTLGFSFGAMISFISSTKVDIDTQILCSLSPYFKEDLSLIRKWWLKSLGKNRTEDFHQFSYKKLSPLIKTKTFLLIGEKETKEIFHTDNTVFNLLKCKKTLTIVKGSKHDIGDENYLKSIEDIVDTL